MSDVWRSAIVTGAGGMLGRALVDALKQRGVPTIAVARAALDITNETAVRRLFEDAKPSIVFNCAAHTKVDLCETDVDNANAINGHAVGILARLSRELGVALVQYSTDFVFDGTSRRPYTVDDAPNPISVYGQSKLLGERELQSSAPDRWVLLRTAWVYGQGGSNFPRVIVERARGGHALKVVDDETGSPTFTADLAEASIDLLDKGGHGIYHATNSGSVDRFKCAQAVLDEFGVKADLSPTSTEAWRLARPNQARRPAYSVLDTSKLEAALERPMRNWRDALRDFHGLVNHGGF